ncbi:MAG TPA: PAS domain-containing sensor histidine kinase, partial [Chitinophagaceae bacterium]|nr:PAS domain-containing sensor histidine kinase [Chitinophagaceae bacterium]
GRLNDIVEYRDGNGDSFFVEATVTLTTIADNRYYLYVLNPVERSFFELVTMGIVMVNEAHKIVSVNPFLLNMFGYEKNDLLGEEIELLIPSRYREKHVEERKQFAAVGKSRPMGAGMELYALKKNGTEFPVEVGLGAYHSQGGKYTLAFITDVTLRKQAENRLKNLNEELELLVSRRTDELQRTMQALASSKNELRKAFALQKALVDSAGAIIISVDNDGFIQSINREGERRLGYTASELVGKQTPLLFHDTAEIQDRARQLSRELRKNVPGNMEVFFSRARLGEEYENRWTYIGKEQNRFPVQLQVSAIRNEEDQIIGFIGVAIDITKTRQTEVELNAALTKEKELGELKSRFVTMASHEFRTPLSTILSSAYLAEKYTAFEDQPKRSRHLQRIVSSVAMLTDILDDFLSIGKIEEGKVKVHLADFNLCTMINSTIAEVKPTLKDRQLMTYLHEGAETVCLDQSLLQRVLLNLISNASKFSADDGQIQIHSVVTPATIALSVSDNGIGIPQADQAHLKERFFRGSNALNIQGTGLGLHIVDKYSELMHGEVTCESELYKGTRITVNFPKQKITPL